MTKKELVINALSKPFSHFISDVTKHTKLSKEEVREILDELISLDLVHVNNGSYYIKKKGIIEIKNNDFGFIIVNSEEEDYYISSRDMKNAYNGDTVSFYVLPKIAENKKNSAVVIDVLERKNSQIFGILITKKSKRGTEYFIVSRDKSNDIRAKVEVENLNGGKDGDIVVGNLNYNKKPISAVVTKVLGHKDALGVDIELIAMKYGFESEYPKEVLDELISIPDELDCSLYKDRRDFTNDLVITIDGVDSKDFDDAISLEVLPSGNYLLTVHIADVSEYVKEDSQLDIEAYKRGTSVYLADRVIPMLPKKLSNGICSLNENVYRLVLSAIMEIDETGTLVRYDICEGIIKSSHRMTYDDVNKMLINNDAKLISKYSDIYPMLLNMAKLSKIIRDKRYKNGALDFDVPEYKVILDEFGKPIDFVLRERDKAELLIEDFMLMANETVAYHMNLLSIPSIYRVHENPDQEKLNNVFNMLRQMGYKVANTKNEIKPKMIQSLMEGIKEKEEYYIINNFVLRAMMKAKYSDICLGHYGLAFEYYCHFTSPIRRYPDLMVHRLLKKLLLHPSDTFNDDIKKYQSILSEIALQCSIQEKKSVECEREVMDMLQCMYISKYIGNTFEGIINSVVPYGLYVTLSNGVEGLIHINNMKGYYVYNEKNVSLVSMNNIFKIGDKINVVVYDTNKFERTIDFILEKDYIGYKG